jgi:RecA-family ATPase
MSADTVASIPVTAFGSVLAHQLQERPKEQSWLIEELWAEAGVGIVGGAPKCAKSWLTLEMAVSVATGTSCLSRFAVPRPGPVLLYAAEDPLPTVRTRLAGLCACRGVALEELAVHVITEPAMRLDQEGDRARLTQTVAVVHPRLLILDPLVRIYGKVDENSASEVSGLLAFLRALQRSAGVAILVVHHARKSQAGVHQAGQALRGSGDLHAWGDSNLYMRRLQEGLTLVTEHRSAQSMAPLSVALVQANGKPPHLEILATAPAKDDLEVRLLAQLTASKVPQTTEALREAIGVRKTTLIDLLKKLEKQSRIARSITGWVVQEPDSAQQLLALPLAASK